MKTNTDKNMKTNIDKNIKKNKKANKDQNFIKAFAIMFVITVICMLEYFVKANFQAEHVSGYAFWKYVKTSMLGEIAMMMSVFIVATGCVYKFSKQIKSGFFKNLITREKYKKFLVSSLANVYLKAVIILPAMSVIAFVIGILMYGTNIDVNSNGSYLTSFYQAGMNNPLLYVVLATVLLAMFSIVISNLALIIDKKIRHFSVTLILTFLAFNVLSYPTMFLFKVNLFYAYQPPANGLTATYIIYSILTIITTLITYLMYKNKEKLVLENG
ncbi:MAG: hypothetical protein RR702_04725 [Clostridia bacterium]